ncbi:MAG TPA: hypothetical protein DDW34_10625 [Clostridium sp.]|nr:hypothetical protein [Clostridium sp.]
MKIMMLRFYKLGHFFCAILVILSKEIVQKSVNFLRKNGCKCDYSSWAFIYRLFPYADFMRSYIETLFFILHEE